MHMQVVCTRLIPFQHESQETDNMRLKLHDEYIHHQWLKDEANMQQLKKINFQSLVYFIHVVKHWEIYYYTPYGKAWQMAWAYSMLTKWCTYTYH